MHALKTKLGLLSALLLTVFAPAFAAPVAQVNGGKTAVALSSDFTGALSSLGVTPARVCPGELQNGVVSFPVVGGVVDAATFGGNIFHSGGLSLTAGDTNVKLMDFIIDTSAESPVLTGLVFANDDLVGRITLFDLALNSAPVVTEKGKVKICDVVVTLSADAANALNSVFGVEAFVQGLPIGVAGVCTKILNCADRPADKHCKCK